MLSKFTFTDLPASIRGENALEVMGIFGRKVQYYDHEEVGPSWAVVPNYADRSLVELAYEAQYGTKPSKIVGLSVFSWERVGEFDYRINGCHGGPLCSKCSDKGQLTCQIHKFSEGFLPKEVMPC